MYPHEKRNFLYYVSYIFPETVHIAAASVRHCPLATSSYNGLIRRAAIFQESFYSTHYVPKRVAIQLTDYK